MLLLILCNIYWFESETTTVVEFHICITGNTNVLFCLMTSRIMSETGYTVQVTNLSSRVSENDLHEFFSFSGPIEHIELIRWFFFTLFFLRESKSDVSRPFFILDKCHIDFLIKKDNCYLRHFLSSQTRQSKCIWSEKKTIAFSYLIYMHWTVV